MQAAFVRYLHEEARPGMTSGLAQRALIRHDALAACGDPVPRVKAFAGAAAVHDPSTQQSPSAQTVPHAPQLRGSARSSVHMPPQTEPEQVPQEPFTHESPGAHLLPHAPQLNGSQFMSGQ